MPPEVRHTVGLDFNTAVQQTQRGVTTSYSTAQHSYWKQWEKFCHTLWQDPLLQDVADPTALLQIFAVRVRDGRCAPGQNPVKAGTVSSALLAVGQKCAFLGSNDPRLDSVGRIDRRITRQIKFFEKTDPAPIRVQPIPISILQHAVTTIRCSHSPKSNLLCAADMIIIAFFFLMRPGEYCSSTSTYHHPFRLMDVELYLGSRRLNLRTATEQELLAATFVKITFSTQKNEVRGVQIGQSRSGIANFCAIMAIARRVIHLRRNGAPPDTPLCAYWRTPGGKPYLVQSQSITTILRTSATLLGPDCGIDAHQINAHSLRSSGAMALLCGGIDRDLAQLFGRWKSDAMLVYLHVQAVPIVTRLTRAMVQGGFTMKPPRALPSAQQSAA